MKRMITFLITIFTFLSCEAPISGLMTIERVEPIEPVLILFHAICQVETGRRVLINHEEGAYGIAQITQAKLDDFNRAKGKRYTLNDCLRVSISKEVFFWHIGQYKDIDKGIRSWNGSGKKTFDYLRKVKTVISKNSNNRGI